MRESRKCAICGKLFFPRNKNAKYCSVECAKEGNRKKARERKRLEKTLLQIESVVAKKPAPKKAHKMSELAEFNAAAREVGMNYGQLEAQRWLRENGRICKRNV